MTTNTLLRLSGMGIPDFSARGISQTLVPIRAASFLSRTINGTLLDVSETTIFDKYQSSIKCSDFDSPALDGIFPGDTLTVDCIAELAYDTGSGGPTRTAVPGSERAEGTYSFYRPRLIMMVTNFSTQVDEYEAEVAWSLDLEEV